MLRIFWSLSANYSVNEFQLIIQANLYITVINVFFQIVRHIWNQDERHRDVKHKQQKIINILIMLSGLKFFVYLTGKKTTNIIFEILFFLTD